MTAAPPHGPGEDRGRDRELRRFLFAAGTRHYPAEPELDELPGVDEDVDRVTALFAPLGYRRILPHLGRNPDAQRLLAELEEWLQHPDRSERDVLVLYYAGHGIKHPQRRQHYLMCGGSRIALPQSTAVRSGDLAGLLASSPVGHVLMLLDTCYAGAGTAEMAAVAHDLVATRPHDGDGPWLMAAARAREQAVDHAFVPALEHALAISRAGMRQPHLDPVEITGRVDAHLRAHHPHQSARCSATDVRVPPPFFPNPAHRPGLPPDLLDIRAAREWAAHFDPRSRGVEYASEKGDHFTGRLQALAVLAGWLRRPQHDSRARVVTGGPGSGKSAVLGRLLALADADPARRPPAPDHVLPPPGCVTAAVHARGSTLEALTERLAAALDVAADTVQQLLSGLVDRATPCTVLIDALDEAGTGVGGSEPRRIARELLRPLSALPQVRLIVGSRRETVPDLGSAVEIVDLDTDAYTGPEDVEEYVRSVLTGAGDAAGCAYRGPGEPASVVAAAVARRAGRSFLVARMTVRALLHGDLTVDTTVPGWEERLPSEAGQAFHAYLARYGEDEERVRRLLTPLAYAEGDGLPWDSLWGPLATALSGVPCSDEDIDWLFRHAGAYVVEVPVDDERSVFRLFHEALAEYLRNPRRDTENQRRITDTLLASVPAEPDGERDWPRAHPYVLSHLPGHATAAREFERLLGDAGLLVHTEPHALLSALEEVTGPAATAVRAMYRTSAHLYRHATFTERTQILAVDAARFRSSVHREQLDRRLEWRPRWATSSQTSTAFRAEIASDPDYPPALACAVVDGMPVAVTNARPDLAEVRDLGTGSRVAVLRGHTDSVTAIACTVLDGDPVAVTGSADGTVRVWDLGTAAEVRRFPVPGGHVVALACTEVAGAPVVVGHESRGAGWLWELRTGTVRYTVRPNPRWSGGDATLACLPLDDTVLTLVTRADHRTQVWDLTTGRIRGLAQDTQAYAVACTRLDGLPTVLLGGRDGPLVLRDPESGTVRAELPLPACWVTAIACTGIEGTAVAVLGLGDGGVLVVDLRTGALLGRLNGHGDWVHQVVCTTLGGSPVVVTASSDGSVRLWDLVPIPQAVDPGGHNSSVEGVADCVVGGVPVAVSAGHDRSVRMWDLASGRALARWEDHAGWVDSVACVQVDGAPVAVTSSHDGSVHVRGLTDGTAWTVAAGVPWKPAVACTVLRGEPVAVVAEHTYGDRATPPLRVWNLSARREIARLDVAMRNIGIMACTVLDGRPTLVAHGWTESADRTVQLWDLLTGETPGELVGCTDQINAMVCTVVGDAPLVITGSAHHGASVWDLRTRKERFRLDGGMPWVNALACTVRDGTPVVAAVGYHDLQVWDLLGGRLVQHYALPHRTNAVAVGAGGELIVGTGYEVLVLERAAGHPARRGPFPLG
ncbi:caspase family protein [Streptomyces sp. bgisy100]|uniref:caspase family protein n=1 Tax=Streptomyces sp. bgisy100 TaxID=3413783 RepID=UPI003D7274DA